MRDECLSILMDLKEEMKGWEWEEDYYHSGLQTSDQWLDWTLSRMDLIIDIVDTALENCE